MKNKNEKLRLTVKAALFAAMLCVLSPLTIPAGAVPFSLSLAAVYLCGAFQTPLYAVASTVCYLILGACGLPVFSNFSGGIGKLIGPTGGYLFSYPLTALAVALSVKLFKKRSVLSLSVGMTVGCLLSYTCGTLYYMGDRRRQPRRGACVLRGAVHLVRRTQDRFLHRPRHARSADGWKRIYKNGVCASCQRTRNVL